MKLFFTQSKGSLLLEGFLSVMIISIAFAALLDIGALSAKTSRTLAQNDQANFLLKEDIEAVRDFRDGTTWSSNGLGTVTTGSSNPYHISLMGSAWSLGTGTETVGNFTRSIVFDKVSRDPTTNNIENTYNSAHDDPNTLKVTVTIASTDRTFTLSTYLTNWKQ